jgi:integrase
MSYAVAEFGKRPIAGITADEVLTFLLGFEERGLNSTARSIRQKMSAVFCRATLLGACNGDPTSVLKREMHPPRSTSHPAIIEPVKFGALLRAIWRYPHQGTRTALQLIALTFQRPHMVRAMRWEDINWQEERWELSAEQMKGAADVANDHIVPLSAQALQLLRDWYAICDRGSLVFPARGHVDKPLSPQAMSQALNALGYAGVHVPHGFRASANTLLLERLGYLQKTIDLQLAHIEENQVRRAYDRTAFLDSRVAMMQAWADYCDGLRRGGEVVTLGHATKRGANRTK